MTKNELDTIVRTALIHLKAAYRLISDGEGQKAQAYLRTAAQYLRLIIRDGRKTKNKAQDT